MSKFIDLSGHRFGRLTVQPIFRLGRQTKWLCLCDCGGLSFVQLGNLRNGHTTSCGCHKETATLIDRSGERRGRLTVIRMTSTKPPHYLCRCDCGTERIISANLLRNIYSCGCLRLEKTITHGLSRHPLYGTWKLMHERCYNPSNISFKYYGARGIKVCSRWHDVRLFIEDMSPRPDGMSIDRIDNDADYSPNNCTWATRAEQTANRRPWGSVVKHCLEQS